MSDVLALLAIGVPVVALVAVTVALLRMLGPLDLTALWYTPREVTWPRGVQEEDPRPWDFASRPAELPGNPTDPALGDGLPADPTASRPTTRHRRARR